MLSYAYKVHDSIIFVVEGRIGIATRKTLLRVPKPGFDIVFSRKNRNVSTYHVEGEKTRKDSTSSRISALTFVAGNELGIRVVHLHLRNAYHGNMIRTLYTRENLSIEHPQLEPFLSQFVYLNC